LKVYLDDSRETPDGFTRTYSVEETVKLLAAGEVEELSLDHDLGIEEEVGTGYDVLLWLEEQVALHGFRPPRIISIHSDNAPARQKMILAVERIRALREAYLRNGGPHA
jgi:hypothetical protein